MEEFSGLAPEKGDALELVHSALVVHLVLSASIMPYSLYEVVRLSRG